MSKYIVNESKWEIMSPIFILCMEKNKNKIIQKERVDENKWKTKQINNYINSISHHMHDLKSHI
jgi:hypothetical protein